MTPALADPMTEEGAETDETVPRRRRRRLITGPTMGVLALVTCAVGFYGGIRVEKSHASASTGAGSFAAVAGAGRTGAAAAGGGTSGTKASGKTAAAGAGGRGGFAAAGGFPGGSGGAGGTLGTVASVNGRTLVLTETGGNTVKVKLTSSTTITKTETVGHKAVHPGDTISVTGSTGKGTVTAASVTDSGDTSTTSSSSSTSGLVVDVERRRQLAVRRLTRRPLLPF